MIKRHFLKYFFPNFHILYSTQNAITKINMQNHKRTRTTICGYNQLRGGKQKN